MIIDVRTKEEYTQGCCQDSVNIPLDTLETELQKLNLDKTTEIVVCCESGGRSAYACALLQKLGFTHVKNGGSWRSCK